MGALRTVTVEPTCGAYLLLFLLAVCWMPDEADASASCRGSCLNGGNMLMPNNIFGFCRCQCAPGYTGPRCQFPARKRSPLPRPVPLEWGLPQAGVEQDFGNAVPSRDVWSYLRQRIQELNELQEAHTDQVDPDYALYQS